MTHNLDKIGFLCRFRTSAYSPSVVRKIPKLKMVILNVLVRSEAWLGTPEVDPPRCSMVERCKRILVAADPTVLVPGGAFYRSAEGSPTVESSQ